MFEPWQLGMLDEAGYNGIREEHILAVAASLRAGGVTDITWEVFSWHCRQCGVAPENFTQEDLDWLLSVLNHS